MRYWIKSRNIVLYQTKRPIFVKKLEKMEKKITPMNWQSDFKDDMDVISIDNDIILLDNIKIFPAFKYPFKVDVSTAMICTRGEVKG